LHPKNRYTSYGSVGVNVGVGVGVDIYYNSV
jgi:hypothetical protein